MKVIVDDLYIAFTPYQCIVSATLSQMKQNNTSELIILNNFKISSRFLESLHRYFENITVINLEKNTTILKLYYNSKELHKILKEIKKNKSFLNIHSSSECDVYNRTIVSKLCNTFTKYHHFEDGSFEYSDTLDLVPQGIKGKIIQILYYLIFKIKIKYKATYIPGVADWVESVALLYPELCREEIKKSKKNIQAISSSDFYGVINNLFELQSVKPITTDCIVFLDHSAVGVETIKKNRIICKQLKRNGLSVSIKYHPRECIENYYIVNNDLNYTELPANLPAECLIKDYDGVIISNFSSVLHTLKFLNPKLNILCIGLLSNEAKSPNNNYINLLKHIGIIVPSSVEELTKYLNNIN